VSKAKESFLNFFAIVLDQNDEVVPQYIGVDADLQADLTQMFESQEAEFMTDDHRIVEFEPKENYRLEREELYRISNVPLPEAFGDAALKPHQELPFALNQKPMPQILGLFGSAVSKEKVERLLIQNFRSPQLLDKQHTLLGTSGTFRRIRSDGISLAHEIAAIHKGGHLYFRSFAIVSRMFDLADYEPEATLAEMTSFVGNSLFVMDDKSEVLAVIEGDDWLRRRVASIESAKILKCQSAG
jgi:hypothetical protein